VDDEVARGQVPDGARCIGDDGDERGFLGSALRQQQCGQGENDRRADHASNHEHLLPDGLARVEYS